MFQNANTRHLLARQCVIPDATPQGEISFCAYNTGVGWRKIIENMHKNSTVAEWYKKYGRDKIYAVDKEVDLESYEHSPQVRADDKFAGEQETVVSERKSEGTRDRLPERRHK